MRVTSQRYVGKRRTFDLEVAHDDHQFVLHNGTLTSNSHAVSYAIDTYMCAYLLTYYEPEWLCAYAETYSDGSDKKRLQAFSEIKALGYNIVKLDINHADKTWTILPGKRFMPSFLTCKGIGMAAIDEIIRNRPYHTVYDLLWDEEGNWKHSKFNKRVFENLIKVEAFDSMDIVGDDKYFVNYRHMHACIVERWSDLRKKNGRELLDTLAREGRDIPPWTRDEKVQMYSTLLGSYDIGMLMPDDVKARLRDKGVTSIDDAEEGQKKIHWFIIVKAAKKKTKNGKQYLMTNVQGESGETYRMFVWGYKEGKHDIQHNRAYIAEVEKTDFGLSTTPWKMREIGE